MNNLLYIPKTLFVGFRERSDTFTGKLAYVIYKDHSGKLRKEASWNSWRDHKIDVLEIENVATPNFTLNKGVQRSREWFGSGRSMVRVWDPRDFEFEITVDNLLNVLMHADVSKRDITEPCVYAWQGTNLVLLPTNSAEYQESVKHTAKQGVKTSTKDLVAGYTYSIKQDSSTTIVYLGRFDQYDTVDLHTNPDDNTGRYRYNSSPIKAYEQKLKPKKHVFINPKTKEILTKDPSSMIAACVDDAVHPDFAALMDAYYETPQSQPAIGVTLTGKVCEWYGNTAWYEIGPGQFAKITARDQWVRTGGFYAQPPFTGDFKLEIAEVVFGVWDDKTKQFKVSYRQPQGSYRATHPSFNDTGLNLTTPAVVELLADIKQAYTALRPADMETKGQYDTHYNSTTNTEVRAALRSKYKTGSPTLILADGKTAKVHFIS